MDDFYVLPEGLREEALSFDKTANPLILKPVYGSVENQSVVFKQVHEYSAAESQKAGREMRRSVIVAEFTNDRFSRVPKRVGDKKRGIRSELTPQEEMLLAPTYERFKTQEDSNETQIFAWEAITDLQKSHITSLGIFTVEALRRLPQEQKHSLGPSADELLELADMHLATKRVESGEDAKAQVEALIAEKDALAKRAAEAEEKYYAKLAEEEKARKAAEAPKAKARKGKKKDEE